MSPQRRIWAFKNNDRIEFTDGLRKITYDYTAKTGRIVKRRPSDEDRQRVAPVDFAREDVLLSGWLFGEKVVEQHRRDVVERGRNWIEFELVFSEAIAAFFESIPAPGFRFRSCSRIRNLPSRSRGRGPSTIPRTVPATSTPWERRRPRKSRIAPRPMRGPGYSTAWPRAGRGLAISVSMRSQAT